MKELDDVLKAVRRLTQFAVFLAGLVVFVLMLKSNIIQLPSDEEDVKIEEVVQASPEEDLPGEIGSTDGESGLIIDHGFTVVRTQCGACHSTRLVAQNRFSRDGWLEVIRWMQEKQNLWDLGAQESLILDYLEKNYAPLKTGRRKNLENIEWYDLN